MKGEILYLEGAAGMSGDMTVGALLDLGGSREKMERMLRGLPVGGFEWEVRRRKSHGLEGCDFDVRLTGEAGGHRHLGDILEIIRGAELTEGARATAERAFRLVAEAEAKAHGCGVEEVHFHEIGAVDSIADILAASLLADDLGAGGCVVTGLTEGTGTVRCAHGVLPVPVPAVVNIAAATGIVLRRCEVEGEMVTPTGIALAAALRTRGELPAAYRVKRVGMGTGKRDYGRPAVLRAMLLEEAEG